MSDHTAADWRGGAFWRTDRGRLLIVLVLLALVTSLAAAVAVMAEARRTAPRFAPAPVFPGLESRLDLAASVSVTSPEGRIEVRRTEEKRWVVPSASNYPAHAETVRKMLLGLASLKAVELKTARRDWLEALDLVEPDKRGKATEIRLSDGKSALMAGLLVGKLRPAGGPGGEDAFYVRRLGEDQAYLAEGDLPLDVARSTWLDPLIVEIPRERIFRVSLTPLTGPAFSLSRASPETQNFALDAVPPGRRMVSETAGNPIGAALSDFTLEDVRPRAEMGLDKAARAAFETFDGLVVTVEAAEVKDEHWVRLTAAARSLNAQAQGAKAPDAGAEAKAINARAGAWVYKVPEWKAEMFARTLDSLLAEPEKETNAK